MQIPIIFESSDILAVYKPAGLCTHSPAQGVESLHDLVQKQRGERLGLHHRLDKETSGAMVFSRTSNGAKLLARAFEKAEIMKRYIAVVCGKPTRGTAILEHRLQRKGAKSFIDAKGKRVSSRFRLLENQGPFSLLSLDLHTGFTHQLRAQCAHEGFPILGDALYGGGEFSKRMYLHACSIKFPDSYQIPEIIADLPQEFAHFSSLQLMSDILNISSHMQSGSSFPPSEALRMFTPQKSGISELVLEKLANSIFIRHLEPAGQSLWSLALVEEFIEEAKRTLGVENHYYRVHKHPKSSENKKDIIRIEDKGPARFYATEASASYIFELNEGPATGLYLDQRENRQWVMNHARGSVLNLFAYTCAFSLTAALGNPNVVCTSVDASKHALELGRENFLQNQLDPSRHCFLVEDVGKFLKKAKSKSRQFDLIICDPPAFGRAGKTIFSLVRDLDELIFSSLALLAPKGYFLISINHRDIRLKRLIDSCERAQTRLATKLVRVKQEITEPAHGPLGVGTDLKTLILQRGD